MRVYLKKGEESSPVVAGVWGQMTWRRFAEELLRRSGEVTRTEEVLEVETDEKWIRFRVQENRRRFRARRVWVTHRKLSAWMWELSLPGSGKTPTIYPSLPRLMDRVYTMGVP